MVRMKSARYIRLTIGLTLFLLSMIWTTAHGTEPIEVFVSIVPQKYFVEKIGGESVKVSVMVTKNSAIASEHTLTFKVNGRVMSTRTVALEAGESRMVVFSTWQWRAGVYVVDVNGLTDSFEVLIGWSWWARSSS